MTRTHYLLILAIAIIATFTGCSATSRMQLTAAGKVLLPIAQKFAVDEFNLWLNSQTL